MRIGLGLGITQSRGGSGGGGGGATAPAAFTAGQWGWATAGTGQITVNLLVAPSDGGSAITRYEYKIGAGAWTTFGTSALGSYTISGFTDGVATDLMVRAVNAIGNGPDSDVKSVTSVAGTLPSAFTLVQWGVVNAGAGSAKIGLQFFPAKGTGEIIGVQYRIAGGSWVYLPGWSVGDYTITGITDGAWRNVELRMVTTVGAGSPSDVKEVWTGVGVMPQIAYFGAKTLTGKGVYRPLDHNGVPQNLTGSPTAVVGNGAYTAVINADGLGTGLAFTLGGAGAPDNCTLTAPLAAGGTVDLKVRSIPGVFHTGSIPQAQTIAGNGTFTLGDIVRFRAGWHNPTAGAVNATINRNSNTPGTWAGAGDIKNGNWVIWTRDPANIAEIGCISFGQGGNAFLRYWRAHDMLFRAPMTADANGLNNVGAMAMFESGGASNPWFACTNCQFYHTDGSGNRIAVKGSDCASGGKGNVGPHRAITMNSGPYWIESNVIDGCNIGLNLNSSPSNYERQFVQNNVIKNPINDGMLIGVGNNTLIEGNIITNKIHGNFPRTVSAVSRGATTTFTVPNTTDWQAGEGCILRGFTGSFASLNGTYANINSLTGTTVTIQLDTSAIGSDDITGIIAGTNSVHGDYIQFSENNGATGYQNMITLRNNRCTRGDTYGEFTNDGGGIFMGNSGTTAHRCGWIVEGNIVETCLAQGLWLSNLHASIVRSNTIIRGLGVDGATTNNQVPKIDTNGANIVVRDNLVTDITLAGAVEDTNNVPITLTVPTSAVPALPVNVSLYESHFANPTTVADEVADALTAYAVKISGGAQAGPTFAGSTPYMNYVTNVYTSPRAAIAPLPFTAQMWTLVNAGTAGDATINIVALPWNGDSAITALEYSIAGGAWTAFVGTGVGARTIAGFTDGVATNVNIRAVNAIGPSATSDTKSVTTS